jgi:hypothetical protein
MTMNATINKLSRIERRQARAIVHYIRTTRIRISELLGSPQTDVTRLMIQEAFNDLGFFNTALDRLCEATGRDRAELIALAK